MGHESTRSRLLRCFFRQLYDHPKAATDDRREAAEIVTPDGQGWVVGGFGDEEDAVERDETKSGSLEEGANVRYSRGTGAKSRWLTGWGFDDDPTEAPADGESEDDPPSVDPTDEQEPEGDWVIGTAGAEGDPVWEVGDDPYGWSSKQWALGILRTSVDQGAGLEALIRYAVEALRDGLSTEYAEFIELSPGGKLFVREGIGWKARDVVRMASVESDASSYAGYALARAEGCVLVANVSDERRFEIPESWGDHGVASSLIGAVRAGKRTFGVLAAHSVTPNRFDGEEARFLNEVASVLSLGIERACERRAALRLEGGAPNPRGSADQRLGFLVGALETIASTSDKASALRGLARLVVPALADWCFVDVLAKDAAGETVIERVCIQRTHTSRDTEGPGLETNYRCPTYPDAPHGTMRAVRTGEHEIGMPLDDTVRRAITNDEEQLRLMRYLGPGSYMCVPLRSAGRTFGALVFLNFGLGTKPYDEQDLILAKGIATTAASAIEAASPKARSHSFRGSAPGTDLPSVPADGPPTVPRPPKLTRRHSQVLRLLARELTDKEISAQLHVSEGTAKKHVQAVRQAFDVHTRQEAVFEARQRGMLPA